MRLGLVIALGLAAPALAQTADDPRLRTFAYEAGRIYHIPTSPQAPQTVLFAPGEQIRSIIVSDPAAYQVQVAPSGDSLTFRAAGTAALAAVSIKTDRGEYQLELAPVIGDAARVPQIVKFSRSSQISAVASPPLLAPTLLSDVSYRVKGSDALRPQSIGDDGSKTYITWRADQALPAVFALGPSGSEEMVDGYVRAGRFTIDRVYDRLLFKLDREVARAERTRARSAK